MIDINELRRLAQAATPGPWYVTGKLTRYVEARIDGGLIQEVAACGPTKADGGYGPQQEANARLIAAANPAAITELLDRLEAAERDVALKERVIDALGSELNAVAKERDILRAKIEQIEQMERQEPVGVLHVGSCYGEELEDWEFEANQCACDKLNEAYVSNPTSLPLYALPGAQARPAKNAVAYLDLGTGGYMDVGTDLTDEELAALPKGRHMLGIIGTYGVDGDAHARRADEV